MSAKVFTWEDPFRPIFEYVSIGAWFVAAMVGILAIGMTQYPTPMFMLFITICVGMGAYRTYHAIRLWRRQKDLAGTPVTMITRDQFDKVNPRPDTEIFLGYGFPWGQEEAQMAHMLIRSDPDRLTAKHERQKKDRSNEMGQPWIHGIGKRDERKIMLPLAHTAGHLLLLGTTRAGKTRFLDLIISQAIKRGEAVVIWDPKGDRGLMNTALRACERTEQEDKFVYFHPAFPEKSARIDPLRNFNRATELATRIAVLIPSETGGDVFMSYSQMLLTNICEGLLIANIKPTLTLLKRYVASGVEEVVIKATKAYCDANFGSKGIDWEAEYKPYAKKVKEPTLYNIAVSYVNFYREWIRDRKESTALEGLYGNFEHERQHAAKMTASLTPVLNMLTAGTLGPLLSPNSEDAEDDRPITDFARIIRNKQVCYVGLDSLSDNMVGSAIGSMFLSDMTAVSGDRYNYQIEDDQPVTLIVDEAAELANDKLVQLLNKAGGSNIRLVIATQTMADVSSKLGSVDKARMLFGNLNNTIVLRTIDGGTQEYIAEDFPQTYIRHIEYSQAMDTGTQNLIDFSYRINESMKEVESPLVTPQNMGILPNLEFFAKLSGGDIWKGRIPLLID